MTQMSRLSEDDKTFESSLIHAARRDSPDTDAEARLLSALGVGAAAAAAGGIVGANASAAAKITTLATSGSLTFSAIAKWLGIGVIGALAAVGAGAAGNYLFEHRDNGPATSVSAVPPVPAKASQPVGKSPPEPAASSVAPPAVVLPDQPATRPQLPFSKTAPPPVVFAAPSSSSPVVGDQASKLREEVALVSKARDALARRDGAAALSALDRYHAVFPQGKLAPEADTLRLEALLLAGRAEEAREEARRALQSNPTGAYSARLREIAQKGPRDDSEIIPLDRGHDSGASDR